MLQNRAVPIQWVDASATQTFWKLSKKRWSHAKCPVKIRCHAAMVRHMGNMAYKTGGRLFWNAKKGSFDNVGTDSHLDKTYLQWVGVSEEISDAFVYDCGF